MKRENWVIFADASSATVLATDSHLRHFEVEGELAHPTSRRRAQDLMADDRGRTRPRHMHAVRGAAVDYRTPPHEVEAAAFSREIAQRLRAARVRNQCRKIVLVAPPSFLGMLRGALDPATRDCVRASIAKNYTNERPEDALEHVRKELYAL